MTKARDLMTSDLTICSDQVTVAEAARQMARRNIGALPVRDAEGHLAGVITDRDLALRVVAEGLDPSSTHVADLLDGSEVVTIGADDSAEETIRTMQDHAVRRLPVIDGARVVGMVTQADIARGMPDAQTGGLVGAISGAPANGAA